MVAKLLNFSTNTIYFNLVIVLYDCNITKRITTIAKKYE